MWPFKSKIDQLFENFLSPDKQKSLAAKAAILKLVENDADFSNQREYQMKQLQITNRLLAIKSTLAAETFLKFIEKYYIGSKIEPMIEYLLKNNHKEDLIERLVQNRIEPNETMERFPSSTTNRSILIRYLVEHCAKTGDHSFALSLIQSFNDRDNREEGIEGVGMDIPFAEVLSLNGEEALLAALKRSKGYNQFSLLCRALRDCGTEETISFLSGWQDPGFARPVTTFGVDPQVDARVTIERINWRLAGKPKPPSQQERRLS